nr:hypothetical protein [uncultured Mediterranean phage uvMED]
MAELTKEDLLNDSKFMETVLEYRDDRYQQRYDNLEDALDDFMEDYRAMQTNTYSTLNFARYAEGIEDQEFKKRFADAYKKVDDELENKISGEAILDYAKYAILDPINLLGLGTVKAISFVAGRQALKNVVSGALNTKLKQTAATGLAVGGEGAVAEGLTEQQIQSAEKDLGARTEYDLGDIAFASGVGGVTGGVLGSAASSLTRGVGDMDDGLLRQGLDKITGGKPKASDLETVRKEAAEAYEKSTDQGNMAQFNNVLDYFSNNPDKNIVGKYVQAVKGTVDETKYDGLGRITDFNLDDLSANVEFLPTDSNLSPIKKSVKFTDIKGVTQEETDKLVKTYVKDYGKFFDKTAIQEGKDFINKLGLQTEEETNVLFTKGLNETTLDSVDKFILDIAKSDPKRFSSILDDRKRVSEEVMEILSGMSEGEFANTIPQRLADNGLTLDEFTAVFAADVSIAARKLAKRGVLSRKLNDLMNKSPELINKLMRTNKELTQGEIEAFDLIRSQRRAEAAMAKRMGLAVDTWRSFLITQPATTFRNIFGSVLRAPGESLSTALDQFFVNIERKSIGLDPLKREDILKSNPLRLIKGLMNPEEQVLFAEIVSKHFPQAEKTLFRTFDDYMSFADSYAELQGKGYGTLRLFGKLSQWANVLNRAQDTSIKSVGFMADLDRQVKRAVNLGQIDKSLNIKGIDDIIRTNNLDLLTDEMLSKSLQFAYKMTYQSKRAGDNVVFLGPVINSAQEFLNDRTLLKLGVPFPNFIMNSMAYTLNRAMFFGSAKVVVRSLQKRGAKTVEAGKDRIKKLDSINEELKLSRKLPKQKVKELKEQKEAILKETKEVQKNYTDIKDGIQETIEGTIFLGTAMALLEAYGGETYNELKVGTTKVDVKPLYPIPVYLYVAEFAKRLFGFGKPKNNLGITDEFLAEGIELFTGLNPARAGALPRMFSKVLEIDNIRDDPYAFGQVIGDGIAYIIKGLGTPTRILGDAVTTFGRKELRYRQDKDLDVAFDDYGFGFDSKFLEGGRGVLNAFLKGVGSGTVVEAVYDSFNPEKIQPRYSPTTGKEEVKGDVPILPQFTGTRATPPSDPVADEMKRLEIPVWKISKYTSEPAYNSIFRKYLGDLSKEKLVPFIKSQDYLSRDDETRKEMLLTLVRNDNSSDLDPRVRKAILSVAKINVSLTQMVTDRIKTEKPILHKLVNLKKKGKKKVQRALEQFPGAKLIYKDPTSEDSEAKNQDLNKLIDNVMLEIKERERAIQRTDILNQRDGGYVSQMDTLGFAEGGNVGMKGGTVLGKTADLNNPMTESQREAGKRSITGGRVARALPMVNMVTESLASGNPLEQQQQRRVGPIAQTQKMLKEQLNPNTKQQVEYAKKASKEQKDQVPLNPLKKEQPVENLFDDNLIKELSKVNKKQISIGTTKRSGTAESGETHKLIKEGKVVSVRINLNSNIKGDAPVQKVLSVHDKTPAGPVLADKPYVTVKPTKDEPVVFLVNQKARGQIASREKAKYPMMGVRGGYSKETLSLNPSNKTNNPIVEIGFNPGKQHLPVEKSTGFAVIGSNGPTLIVGSRFYTRQSDLIYARKKDAPVPDQIGRTGPRNLTTDVDYQFKKGGIMMRRA